jgi:hypothetical protein
MAWAMRGRTAAAQVFRSGRVGPCVYWASSHTTHVDHLSKPTATGVAWFLTMVSWNCVKSDEARVTHG